MTPEEVKELVMEVVKAVEDANVPEDLRATAFEKSFDALIGAAQSGNASAGNMEPRPQTPVVGSTDSPSVAAIASRLGLDPEAVEEIYYVDGETLGLSIASSKFDSRKAGATQQIALLVAAGRQAGGWDEWTPVGRIRDVCRDYGRFDVANFATTIKRMGSAFSFRGRARQVEVRVTRPGYEQAANLVRELVGM